MGIEPIQSVVFKFVSSIGFVGSSMALNLYRVLYLNIGTIIGFMQVKFIEPIQSVVFK